MLGIAGGFILPPLPGTRMPLWFAIVDLIFWCVMLGWMISDMIRGKYPWGKR